MPYVCPRRLGGERTSRGHITIRAEQLCKTCVELGQPVTDLGGDFGLLRVWCVCRQAKLADKGRADSGFFLLDRLYCCVSAFIRLGLRLTLRLCEYPCQYLKLHGLPTGHAGGRIVLEGLGAEQADKNILAAVVSRPARHVSCRRYNRPRASQQDTQDPRQVYSSCNRPVLVTQAVLGVLDAGRPSAWWYRLGNNGPMRKTAVPTRCLN